MPIISDYVEALVANSETVTSRIFKSGPGVPIGLKLASTAETEAPDAPIAGQFPRVTVNGQSIDVDVDLLFPNQTKAQVEADIAALAAQYAATNDPAVKQRLDEKQAAFDALGELVKHTADTGLFSSDYNRAVAIHYQANPHDPVARSRLDRAVESALYLFPEVNGEHTPVRWRYPSREGGFYVENREQNTAGYFRLAGSGDHIRTDLSREAINGQVLGLAQLWAAHPDAQVKDRLKRAITAVAANLKAHGYNEYVDQFGFMVSFSVGASARRMLPRGLEVLVPLIEQADALKGGDKLMVYSMLRAAANVDPANWKAEADKYWRDWKDAFKITSVYLFYKLYTFVKSKTRKYGAFLGLGGLVGAIAGAVLGGLLALVGLPFLTIATLGLLAGLGGAVYILANREVEIDRFSNVFQTIQLEQRMTWFLLQFEDPANGAAMELWQEKLTQAFILNRRKLDSLTTAYFVDSPFGRQLMSESLVKIDAQIASLSHQVKKSKKAWCKLLTSKKKRKKYMQQAELYEELKLYRTMVFLAKAGAMVAAPLKLLSANYGHHYERALGDYNAGGSIGSIAEKLRHLDQKLAAAGGLTLGDADVGTTTVQGFPLPPSFPTDKFFTDEGMDVVQHKYVPEPFAWDNRWSVTVHNPFRFNVKTGGKTFNQPFEALLAWALLRKSGIAI